MRNDQEQVLDILEAIENIERYANQGEQQFISNELVQIWIIHHIQLIGEAAANISDAYRQTYSDINWSEIVAMRNVLVHEYFGIDLWEVWATATNDIPVLKAQIQAIIDQLSK